ncbi:lipoprotein insertase outer membrane protein LolB, partial [Acinetobacter baumannii]
NQWQVQGALGANDGKQAFSANVVWNQNASRFNMTLYGPVGVGTLKIAGIPGQVTLMDSAGKKMNASSPEELLKKQTGWAIPVS